MDKQRLLTIALAILLPIVFVTDVIFTHNTFTARFPGGNDSVPRYVGTRAWLFEGLDPYSEEVSERGQRMIYGRLANDLGEDKARFAYPFYVIFFYVPLAGLSWEWARAIGIVSLEIAMIVITVAAMRMHKWTPPPLLFAFTLALSILFYHGARTIILWQFAGIAAMWIALGLWAIKEKRDVFAGICFALATAKPQMMFLLLPLLGLWSLTARRWRLAASLTISMIVLVGVSFLFVPSWLSEMLNQIRAYQDYTDIGSPINTLARFYFPFLGDAAEWGVVGILLAWLMWEGWQVRASDEGRYDWVMALALVITNLIAFRTATTNYVMMLPALIFVFALMARRWGAKANGWIAAIEIILLVGLWWLFAVTVQGRVEQPPMYLPLPFGLLIALIIFRPKALNET
jgi:hypothetical protein